MTYLYVSPLQCRLKPEICRLKPVTCRPAKEHSRHELVTDCRPEPPCVVTDIPKRANVLRGLNSKLGVISQGIDALWNADLADVSNLTKHNGSTKYLLVAIHVFSRYLWIEPLKNKLHESIIKALQNR